MCDGHRSIWSYAEKTSIYDDYEKLPDFYHTTEHLSRDGEVLFGKSNGSSNVWYNKYSKKLLEDSEGAESA